MIGLNDHTVNEAKLESFDHLARTFWLLDPSCTCLALPLRVMSASNHSWGVLKSRLYPGQIIIVLSLDLALSISLTSDGQRIQREEKSARVLKSKLHSFNVNQSNSLTYDYDYISQDDLTCVHNILPCTTWSTTRYVKSPIADHLMRYTHILFRGTMQLKNWIAVRSHLWFV